MLDVSIGVKFQKNTYVKKNSYKSFFAFADKFSIFLKDYFYNICYVKNNYQENINLSNQSASLNFFLSRLGRQVSLKNESVLMLSMKCNEAYAISSIFAKSVYVSLSPTKGGKARRDAGDALREINEDIYLMETARFSDYGVCISQETMHCVGDVRYDPTSSRLLKDPYKFPLKVIDLIGRSHFLAINVLVSKNHMEDRSGTILAYHQVLESFADAGYKIVDVMIDKTYSKPPSDWSKKDFIESIDVPFFDKELAIANFLLRYEL